MRTGDAEAEIWLEGAGRSYCLTIRSRRLGRLGSKRWQTPLFLWWCERWEGTATEGEGGYSERVKGEAATYETAELAARAAAELLENPAPPGGKWGDPTPGPMPAPHTLTRGAEVRQSATGRRGEVSRVKGDRVFVVDACGTGRWYAAADWARL